ncbi:hypothetical protein [Leptospira sp. GIMC2001]|uniref:hypothetical protein n=1 Tax=Leptospira sp. GIMC2001 TaxID=1513297 RepID=UPI00234BB60A|nr:hypothetical protein [Leptospira sp. GIMC2001]WCL48883.1 hypothetical protein O4O04_16505 [Leptospira sp. GIMC2001]
MKEFKEKSKLRDEILDAIQNGRFSRATALMININYLLIIIKRRGEKLRSKSNVCIQISRKTIRELEKLELLTNDLSDAIRIKESDYMDNGMILDSLIEEDLNSYNQDGNSILFSALKSQDITSWLISLYDQKIAEGMDLFFNELQRNMVNEIFQYKLYLQGNSKLREFYVGENNCKLILTTYKNEKSQTLIHLAAMNRDLELFEDCLDYLNLNPLEEDDFGNTALDYLTPEDIEFHNALSRFGL